MGAGKVLLAMSGGVDSSAAAVLLKEAGFEVEGATMRLWSDDMAGAEKSITGAKSVCSLLGIKHYVIDYADEFKREIVDYFLKEYKSGRTPNPCVMCNRRFKFGRFYDFAMSSGFDFMATGHYARIADNEGRKALIRARYPEKDQSYVLYNLKEEMLGHVLLPLGDMRKEDIRKVAEKNGLASANSPDSQEICFISDDDYAGFIRTYGGTSPEGNFISTNGEILGRHSGITNYTIGQRKGLGISFGEPLYVVEINHAENTVTLGKNSDTYACSVICSDYSFISRVPDPEEEISAKIRYSAPLSPAQVSFDDKGKMIINFAGPQRAAAPGQSAVIYSGEELLGGGVIEKCIRVK